MDVLDYIKEKGNKTFFEEEFNEIDASILSLLTYIDFNKIVSTKKEPVKLKSCLEYFLNYSDLKAFSKRGVTQKSLIKLCTLLKEKIRYQDILFYNYIYKINFDEQFSAITMKLPNNIIVIGYEGTDENLVGWEEDFAMCYKFPVDAEKDAIRYLNKSVSLLDRNVYVLGHSKGGHLAIVASMFSNPLLKLKIKKIYNFDGPGLRKKEFNSSKYKSISNKIEHIVPNYSIIGLLLRHNNNIKSVKSSRKDLYAHSIFTWDVNGFNFTPTNLSRLSKNLDESIIMWLDQHNDQEREKIIKDIFNFLRENNITNTNQLSKIKNLLTIIKNHKDIDVETRNLLANFIKFNYDYHISN